MQKTMEPRVFSFLNCKHNAYMKLNKIENMDCLEYRIFNTICSDVVKRQTEAKQLAKKVDLILVVGGRISANTKHLTQICRDVGTETHHIETEKELRPSWFKNKHSVGVISGASTPEKIVDRVILKLESM